MLTIRPATPGDAAAIAAAERAVAQLSGVIVRTPEEVTLEGTTETIRRLSRIGRYVVAEQASEVAGHGYLEPMLLEQIRHVFRLTLLVHPGAERKGVGRALLDDLQQFATADRRIFKLELLVRSTNRAAIGLYESAGFVQEGVLERRIRLSDGSFIDDISMAWFPSR